MTLPAAVQPLSAEKRARMAQHHACNELWREPVVGDEYMISDAWCGACERAGPCNVLRALATCDVLEAERDAALAALRGIEEQTRGAVCEDYDLCTHRSCQASYAAWAVASAALERLELLAKEGSGE